MLLKKNDIYKNEIKRKSAYWPSLYRAKYGALYFVATIGLWNFFLRQIKIIV